MPLTSLTCPLGCIIEVSTPLNWSHSDSRFTICWAESNDRISLQYWNLSCTAYPDTSPIGKKLRKKIKKRIRVKLIFLGLPGFLFSSTVFPLTAGFLAVASCLPFFPFQYFAIHSGSAKFSAGSQLLGSKPLCHFTRYSVTPLLLTL